MKLLNNYSSTFSARYEANLWKTSAIQLEGVRNCASKCASDMKKQDLRDKVKVVTPSVALPRLTQNNTDEFISAAKQVVADMADALGVTEVVRVTSPVTDQQVRLIRSDCRTVQFDAPLTDDDHRTLSELFLQRPELALRIYGHYSEACPDLSFLRFYSAIRHFGVGARGIQSLDGIELIAPSLKSLTIEIPRERKLSIRFIGKARQLERLHLEGQPKDLDCLQAAVELQRMTLRSVKIPDLSLLEPLKRLWWLSLKLGSTSGLQPLSRIGKLKYLELWMVNGVTELEPLGEVRSLQFVYLQALRRVAALPSCSGLVNLRTLVLDTMKGIRDLSPLREAPRLENLAVISAMHMQPSDFACLKNHPSLRGLTAGLGSTKRNDAVQSMIGLPAANFNSTQFVFN